MIICADGREQAISVPGLAHPGTSRRGCRRNNSYDQAPACRGLVGYSAHSAILGFGERPEM